MKCRICAANNPEGSNICHECGNDLTSILLKRGSYTVGNKSYKMGEEINNGILFWRKTTQKEGENILSECICHCGNKFLVKIHYVEIGKRTSCGCRKKREINVHG